MVHPTKKNGVYTSYFGMRNGTMHNGIDISQGLNKPIFAAYSGKVTLAGVYGGYGNLVEIKSVKGITTKYAHLNKILVKPNQFVNAGQIIGLEGSTGYSTGSHLHFELIINGKAVDPFPYLEKATTTTENNSIGLFLLLGTLFYLYNE